MLCQGSRFLHQLRTGSSVPLLSQARSAAVRHSSSIREAFRDPSSPYHIPPGTQGPASPDHPAEVEDASILSQASIAEQARAKLAKKGYDPASFWDQPIVWGDHDAFQHVNNVRYVRFFESGRMKWIHAVGESIGGPERARMMLDAKGVSFILKSIEVKFRRPTRYPDTLLIAHKASAYPATPSTNSAPPAHPPLHRTQFLLHAAAFSYAQNAVVADSTSVITWYDYEKLSKCDPGDEMWAAVLARTRATETK
ncbi:hypothetical protein EWM64_g2579 [Hericium alpestre]|uniref:Thioesterase domain-containing protein n=1 Tax=Hericium alpestre TaxID=135208 RepID=A0A4Z0A723_9AGAM|nr:hypothetical protein EWM64_g2579 [Hericium alpestre]